MDNTDGEWRGKQVESQIPEDILATRVGTYCQRGRATMARVITESSLPHDRVPYGVSLDMQRIVKAIIARIPNATAIAQINVVRSFPSTPHCS